MRRFAAIPVFFAAAAAFALEPLDIERMFMFAAAANANSAPQPLVRWCGSDLANGPVTNWTARIGSGAFTNWSGTGSNNLVPIAANGEVQMMSAGGARYMRAFPAITCSTNMAVYLVCRREQAGVRFVGLGNAATANLQAPFIFTDNTMYGSLGFNTKTKLGTNTLGTGLMLIGLFRGPTSEWARVNGVAHGGQYPASSITHSFDTLGILSSLVNGCTNRIIDIGVWTNDNVGTTNFTGPVEAMYKTNYPELP